MHSRPMLVFLVLFVAMSAVIILLPSAGSAQDEASPTPAPSKTPTLSLTVTPAATVQAIAAGPTRLTQPFTQADLSVITGNTQRPNGIAWHNDKLYTICSGDWTVYEIDAVTGTTAQYIYGVKNAHTLYPVTESDGLHLWIPDFQTNSLIHISQGVTDTVASDLKGPWGIASLDDDGFAVTNLHGNNLIAVSREGEERELITDLRSPTGVAVDDNYIFIANTGSARRAIEWFDRKANLINCFQLNNTFCQRSNDFQT